MAPPIPNPDGTSEQFTEETRGRPKAGSPGLRSLLASLPNFPGPIVELFDVCFDDVGTGRTFAGHVARRIVHELGAVRHLLVHLFNVLNPKVTGSLPQLLCLDRMTEPQDGTVPWQARLVDLL